MKNLEDIQSQLEELAIFLRRTTTMTDLGEVQINLTVASAAVRGIARDCAVLAEIQDRKEIRT